MNRIPVGATARLDQIDRALLAALEGDGRASFARLGKTVGLSADAVRERLRRLEADGIVEFIVTVDPAAMGFRKIALLLISTQGPLEAIAADLVAVPEIDFVTAVEGRFDIIAEAVCRDGAHLLQVLNERIRSIEGVAGVQVFSYLQVAKWVASVRTPLKSELITTSHTVALLDDIDRRLVSELQRHARASFRDLGARTGLNYALVRRRVQALLSSGVVQAVCVTNRVAMGSSVIVGIGLKMEGSPEPTMNALAAFAEVELAVLTVGPYDAFIEVACRDEEHLAETLTLIRSVAGIRISDVYLYLQIFELPISWSFAQQT